MHFFPRRLEGAAYPPALRDLPHPPDPVYAIGELPLGPSIAVVGTRHPTEEASKFAKELAYGLAAAGVTVFSGGAQGIDTAAHEGALDAGGRTVVVAPSSFDRPFPERNAALFRRIVNEGGAFLTLHPAGTPARQHHFFPRNAVLAALTPALVVVESGYRGGARNAAKAARSLGRRVLVVPGAPWNTKALGCILEIRQGGEAVGSINDVLRSLQGLAGTSNNGPVVPPSPSPRQLELGESVSDPDRAAVVRALENGPLDPDALCMLTSLPAGRVQALLLTLTLERILVSEPSGRVSLATD